MFDPARYGKPGLPPVSRERIDAVLQQFLEEYASVTAFYQEVQEQQRGGVMYEYKVKVLRIVDGDTLTVEIDLGFRVKIEQTVRLEGVNAPEIHSRNPAEKAAAAKAVGFVKASLADREVKLQSKKPYAGDKFGRFLARVFYFDGGWKCLNDELLASKLAKAYSGGKREPWSE